MIKIDITLIHVISFTFGLICFNFITYILDKKTRTKDDISDIELKYILLFTMFGVFCFLFLKQIREKRKINFYERQLNIFNILYSVERRYNMLSEDKKQEMRDINMYLKLKKIKRKSRWSNILGMVRK